MKLILPSVNAIAVRILEKERSFGFMKSGVEVDTVLAPQSGMSMDFPNLRNLKPTNFFRCPIPLHQIEITSFIR